MNILIYILAFIHSEASRLVISFLSQWLVFYYLYLFLRGLVEYVGLLY